MSTEGYIIYGVTILLLIISLIKDKEKTKQGVIKGMKAFLKLMPILIPLFLFVGILLAVVTPQFISSILGEDSGVFGIFLGLSMGSITFMPPFVAFPLGRQLLENGAAYPQVAGFLVTVMSVGLVYLSAERKFFSGKSAVFRNLVSFIGAVIVVIVVAVMF